MKSISTRILSVLLVVVMVFSVIPAVSAYSGVAEWAEKSISAMDDLGLIPDSLANANLSNNISRADMCRVAMLAYTKITGHTPEVPSSHPFSDTTDPDIERAHSIGLITGDGNGKFRPNDALKRAESFNIMYHFLKLVDYPITAQNMADLSSFRDAGSLPGWALDATRALVGLGVVNGTGNELSWRKHTSSQESLTLFYRAYNLAANSTEEPLPPTSDFINLASWAKETVYKMYDLGLIPDEVRNSPMNGSITRANMCKVVMLAYKQLSGATDQDLGNPGASPFSDTSDTDILNAYRLGIVNGMGEGRFAPNAPITRQDFFAVAARFLNAVGYTYTDDQNVNLSVYRDSDKIASYALAPTRLLIGIGAVEGTDDRRLNPRNEIVSQEALVIFYRIYSFYTNWDDSTAEDNRPNGAQEKAAAVVAFAKEYLGYDYTYGGKDPETGFDCSGFVYYVYHHFGYELLPGALSQWESLSTEVEREDLLPGDLVFFSEDGTPDGMTHIAIYIGDDEIIHASTPSTGVIISSLDEPYYVRMYLGAKRVIE